MNRCVLTLCVAVVLFCASAVPVLAADVGIGQQPDEVAFLRAENNRLKTQIEEMKKEIAALKMQIAALKGEAVRADATAELEAGGTKLLEAVPNFSLKARLALVGATVSGRATVAAIEPDPTTKERRLVTLAGPTAAAKDGQPARRVDCIIQAPLAMAERLSKGKAVHLTGEVERVETQAGAQDAPEVIRLFLKSARVR